MAPYHSDFQNSIVMGKSIDVFYSIGYKILFFELTYQRCGDVGCEPAFVPPLMSLSAWRIRL
jgi:hypothetical protein